MNRDRYTRLSCPIAAIWLFAVGTYAMFADKPWQIACMCFALGVLAGAWPTILELRARVPTPAGDLEIEAKKVKEGRVSEAEESRRLAS